MMFRSKPPSNLFCRHTETRHIARDKDFPSRLYLRQCKKCGRYFIYDKFVDRYSYGMKNVCWEYWTEIIPHYKQR